MTAIPFLLVWQQILLLVGEIASKKMLSKLREQSFPESLGMILILKPTIGTSEKDPLTLPPSFLHVTLTTPYRSTIAITRLARFIANCQGLVVPEGDFGSAVEGTKPIFFNVGEDERKMKEALEHCHKHLGDKVTILCDWIEFSLPDSIEKMVKNQGKEEGGP